MTTPGGDGQPSPEGTFERVLQNTTGLGPNLQSLLDEGSSPGHGWFIPSPTTPGSTQVDGTSGGTGFSYHAWDVWYVAMDRNLPRISQWDSAITEIDGMSPGLSAADIGLTDVNRLIDAKAVLDQYLRWLMASHENLVQWAQQIGTTGSQFQGVAAQVITNRVVQFGAIIDNLHHQLTEARNPPPSESLQQTADELFRFGRSMSDLWSEYSGIMHSAVEDGINAVVTNLYRYIVGMGLDRTASNPYVLDTLAEDSRERAEDYIRRVIASYHSDANTAPEITSEKKDRPGNNHSSQPPEVVVTETGGTRTFERGELPEGMEPFGGPLDSPATWDLINQRISEYVRVRMQPLNERATELQNTLSTAYDRAGPSLAILDNPQESIAQRGEAPGASDSPTFDSANGEHTTFGDGERADALTDVTSPDGADTGGPGGDGNGNSAPDVSVEQDGSQSADTNGNPDSNGDGQSNVDGAENTVSDSTGFSSGQDSDSGINQNGSQPGSADTAPVDANGLQYANDSAVAGQNVPVDAANGSGGGPTAPVMPPVMPPFMPNPGVVGAGGSGGINALSTRLPVNARSITPSDDDDDPFGAGDVPDAIAALDEQAVDQERSDFDSVGPDSSDGIADAATPDVEDVLANAAANAGGSVHVPGLTDVNGTRAVPDFSALSESEGSAVNESGGDSSVFANGGLDAAALGFDVDSPTIHSFAGQGWSEWSDGSEFSEADVPGQGGRPTDDDDRGAGHPHMPMMPPGGSPGRTEERQRLTWLTEDADVWGTRNDLGLGILGLPMETVREPEEQLVTTHVHALAPESRTPPAVNELDGQQPVSIQERKDES